MFTAMTAKSSKYKKCRLPNIVQGIAPGFIFNRYGHQWTVQPDKTATAEIHVDFHKVEVALGRYVVLDEEKTKIIAVKDLADEFTFDVATYYGCGDLDKLRLRIQTKRKELLQSFADSRLGITLPPTMSKAEMISSIMNLVELKDENPDTSPTDSGIEDD